MLTEKYRRSWTESCQGQVLSVSSPTSARLYDKRDNFNFPIVNFSFLCSNILLAPAYRVYVSLSPLCQSLFQVSKLC